jgi:hypothetical protein
MASSEQPGDRPGGVTIQVRVGGISDGVDWYTDFLGRGPDLEPDEAFKEWEVIPGCRLQVAEGVPAADSGPLRLEVDDLDAAVTAAERRLGALHAVSRGRIAGLAAWCTFADPWGNLVGYYQALEPDHRAT